MSNIINADNGSVSGVAGLKYSADTSGALVLQTNGTTALTIDTSQNIGIGKAPVNKKLEIYNATNAGIRLQNSTTGTTASDGLLIEQGGVDSYLVNYESGNMYFYTNNTEKMRINSSGGVSIGNTTDPGANNLTVAGTAGCAAFAQEVTLTDSTARTYSANTVYTMPGTVPIIGGGGDTFLVSIIIQYDNVGYHNWLGSCVISLTYWNAYGNSSQWSTQMSTHVNGNPVVTIYDLTGTSSRSIGFSLNNSLTVSSGGFVKITAKRIMSF